MRRHFLALEAFDGAPTGAPTDGEPDANADGTNTDPAAAASVPPAEPSEPGATPPATPDAAVPGNDGNEPDEAVPVDPALKPPLPEEPGVTAPAATTPGAPTSAEPPAAVLPEAPVAGAPAAEPAPAVPTEPTNASGDAELPTESPDHTAGLPASVPSEGAAAPAAAAPVTPGTDGAPQANAGAGEGGDANSQPSPTPSQPQADSEAMEALRERLEVSVALEEAAVEMADDAALSGEIGHDLAESERVIQTSDALEDLAFVASQIKEASPEEAALFETAGNLAVAGTDVEPDAIVPSMESYIGKSIATEGFKDTAKRIWESIVLFVDKIWEKIRTFWRTKVAIPAFRKRIDALRKGAHASGDTPNTDTINVAVDIRALSMGGGIDAKDFANTHDLDRLLNDYAKTVHVVFANYANGVVERGRDIVKAIQDFDPNRPEKAVTELKGKLVGMHMEGMQPNSTMRLLGNAHLELKVYDPHADEPVDEALERLRNSGLTFVQQPIHAAVHVAGAVGARGAQPVDKKESYLQLLDVVELLFKPLEHFYETPFKEMEQIAKQAKTASASAASAIGKAGEGAMAEGKGVSHYRSLLNFNKAFAQWSFQPFVPMFSHTMRLARFILNIAEAGLRAYEGKGSTKPERDGAAEGKPVGA
ncbi:hypothetical protein [Paraburkholderia sp. BCC1886]|uniref:hypothetical protein n=1 Tax=Paraburkholderia sp. BCC1886 TaxID=2562670 RepID=UPI0011844B0B|nr:hypothetical protein [Paraburkholderia sp. BCC1886]